ncbi:MAG TPA: GNAT family N-acetyltransferase [Longimicrobiaceae bacterium]|nr:GNAT family N-acetyltransferase [Longimicrobiaceae bacterium]
MTAPLRVVPAAAGDAYALWLWANDAGTRAASFGRDPIAWADHVAWLERALADAAHAVLVARSADGRPVGSIRFDTGDGWRTARLSYVVAPEARGEGRSGPMVRAGVAWVRGAHPGVAVRARVMEANERSLRVFRRLGWREERAEEGVREFWSRETGVE